MFFLKKIYCVYNLTNWVHFKL